MAGEANRQELRLALAMRGGVSLAVWIGGACAEIDRLRRSAPWADRPDAAPSWRALLDLAGYDRVTVDVLAGASAGGLNAVLLSTALVYDADVTALRDVWLRVADLDPLSVPPEGRASVLNGDQFLEHLTDALHRSLATAPCRTRPVRGTVDHLDVLLAATLLRPAPQHVIGDLGTPFVERRRQAVFRFRMADRALSPRSDLPSPLPDEGVGPLAARMARAGRASASFPGAFEPVPVVSARPGTGSPDGGDGGEGPDLFGTFSEAAEGGGPFWVLDGGVLDNIPVARAIEAIAAARAAGPTERWLLFLHPSPDDGAGGEPPVERPVTVLETLRAVGGRETLLEDMAELERHNAATRRHRARRDGVAATLIAGVGPEGSDGDAPGTGRALAAVVTARASSAAADVARRAAAAERVRVLLRDPVAAIGIDVLPTDAHRTPTAAWPRGSVAGAYAHVRGPAWPTDDDPLIVLGTVARTCGLLIDWARRLERQVDAADLPRVGALKHAAYRVAATADLARSHLELLWPLRALTAVPVPADEPAVAAWATGVRGALTAALSAPEVLAAADDLLTAHAATVAAPDGEAAGAEGATATALAVLDRALAVAVAARSDDDGAPGAGAGAHAPDPTAWRAGLVDPLRRLVGEIGQGLSTSAPGAVPPGAPGAVPPGASGAVPPGASGAVPPGASGAVPSGVAFEDVLSILPMASEDEAVTILEQLDALLAPADVERADATSIRFARISGAAPTPLGQLFPRIDGASGPLGVDDKLAGNQLFNFGAFLKPSWRQNDWMWGRLDTAAHLVDLLTQPARLRAFAGGPDAAAAVAEGVRRVVTAPLVGVDPRAADAWRGLTEQLWAEAADGVVAELRATVAGGSDADPEQTRTVLAARMQWEILAVEVPMLDATARADARRDTGRRHGVLAWLAGRRPRPTPRVPDVVPMTPLEVAAALGAHAVGIADVRDAFGDRRVQLLAGDLAAGTWRAALTHKVGGRNVVPVVGAAVLRPLAALVTRWLGR